MARSATAVWDGVRHPRMTLRHWFERPRVCERCEEHRERDEPAAVSPEHAASSTERLERIAAYARSGYFHVEYTAGMFVVPLDSPPE